MKSMESILVIDEESGLLHTLTLILKRSGYVSYAAIEIDAVLSKLLANKIDMIIINDSFFKFNELNLLMAINNANPDLPILLLAGWLSAETISHLQYQTGCTVAHKPLDPADMIKIVSDILVKVN